MVCDAAAWTQSGTESDFAKAVAGAAISRVARAAQALMRSAAVADEVGCRPASIRLPIKGFARRAVVLISFHPYYSADGSNGENWPKTASLARGEGYC